MAKRDGKLVLTDGKPDMSEAFTHLSRWFVERLNDNQGFGELRDQLLAEFPEEKTSQPSGQFVDGHGHGTLTSFETCSSSGSHIVAKEDHYGTRWNDPASESPRTVQHNVMINDCDLYAPGHVLSSYVSSYPLNGSLVLYSDGSFTYTPDQAYLGADSFWYYVLDQYGGFDAAPAFFYVYEPDVDVDSNNNGTIDPNNTSSGTDDPIEYEFYPPVPNGPDPIGKIIALNDNDDNENGVPDYLDGGPFQNPQGQTIPDNDLVKVELDIQFENGYLEDSNMKLDWGGLNVWDSRSKNNQYTWKSEQPATDDLYDNWWSLGNETLPDSVWVEGIYAGGQILTLELIGQAVDQARVAVVDVDLEIFNGQDATQGVSEALEEGGQNDEGYGAFTVANINDTDGDGKPDYADGLVAIASANIVAGGTVGMGEVTVDDASGFALGDAIALAVGDIYEEAQIAGFGATNPNRIILADDLAMNHTGGVVKHRGRDEVDLMKLIVHRPSVFLPNTNVKLTVVSGNVALWTSRTKGVGTQIEFIDDAVEFNVDGIPAGGLELWVEARAQSTQLRDIEIKLEYMGASDTVNATAVWVNNAVASIHDRQTYQQVIATFPEIVDTTIGDVVTVYDGVGLLPIGELGVLNAILMQFKVEPPNIQAEPHISWDITRQQEFFSWRKPFPSDEWEADPANPPIAFPVHIEMPNDDDIEANDIDESPAPTATGHMYSVDAPGLISPFSVGISFRRLKFHFIEWVRVSFEGSPPSGEVVAGSRTSGHFHWHVRHDLDSEAGVWVRTTGDDPESNLNRVEPGPIFDVFGDP